MQHAEEFDAARLRRDYRRAIAKAKLQRCPTGKNRSKEWSPEEDNISPPVEHDVQQIAVSPPVEHDVQKMANELASKRTLAEVSEPDLYAGTNRAILESCWRHIRGPSFSAKRTCRAVLLFAYGSTPEFTSGDCMEWCFLAVPDRTLILDPLYNKFGSAGLREGFWPELLPRSGGIVWDVGGGNHARGVKEFIYPKGPAHIHIFEIVPQYYETLRETWEGTPNVTLHNFGLDRSNRDSSIILAGGGTSLLHAVQWSADRAYLDSVGDSNYGRDRSQRAQVRIRSAAEIWFELEIPRLSLLHMNCEGCEYVVLPALADAGLLHEVDAIMVVEHLVLDDEEAKHCDRETGTCFADALMYGIRRTCDIRELLARTHRRAFGIPFMAELWKLLSPKT